jgi:hypothetical protein
MLISALRPVAALNSTYSIDILGVPGDFLVRSSPAVIEALRQLPGDIP